MVFMDGESDYPGVNNIVFIGAAGLLQGRRIVSLGVKRVSFMGEEHRLYRCSESCSGAKNSVFRGEENFHSWVKNIVFIGKASLPQGRRTSS
jgi:hypothetical protein